MLPDRTEIEETLCQRLARLDLELAIERADVGTRFAAEGFRTEANEEKRVSAVDEH
jgi:hypothetical protein